MRLNLMLYIMKNYKTEKNKKLSLDYSYSIYIYNLILLLFI